MLRRGLIAGDTVDSQSSGRDPGFLQPQNVSLTDAVSFDVTS